jgi:hypothetical protein
VSANEIQSPVNISTGMKRKKWFALGCACVAIAIGVFFVLGDSSYELWGQDLPFKLFMCAIALVFLLPLYFLYFAITDLLFGRTKMSIMARRRWLVGLPVLFLNAANRSRPSVAIQWILQGKIVTSIHSVRSVFGGTMRSDRSVDWFEIAPSDLRSLIAQHNLVVTNGFNFQALVSEDPIIGAAGIADQIPSFKDPIVYAKFGSDDVQHPFRVIVLTDTNYDKSVWFYSYDR